MCHGALAERGAEEEAAGAAPSGPALPRGLPARGEAVLPARKAHPSSSAGGVVCSRVLRGLRTARWPVPSAIGISRPSVLL